MPCLSALALVLALGCGRTNFASFNPPPSSDVDRGVLPGVDAGPPRDRGIDVPDIGDPPPTGCVAGAPVDVFLEAGSAFDETFIGVRDDGVDLAANIEGDPEGELVARTAEPFGLDVNLTGNRVSLGTTAEGNAVFTSARRQALSVRRTGNTSSLTVWDVVNDSYLERILESRIDVLNVLAAAPVTEGWFYTWFDSNGRIRYQVLDEALMERNPPADLCPAGSCTGQAATATAGADGRVRVIADDTPPSTSLRLHTVGAVGDLDVTTLTLPSVVQGQPGIAVAAAPGGFALAWFDASNLAVTYFPPGETPRSEDVASTMFAQDSPGMAGLAEGVVVAQLTFGDLDPTAGTLQVLFVPFDAGRTVVTATAVEVRRDMGLAASGVSVAALDDTRALVHFTNASGATGSAATQAVVVRCN